MDIAIPLFDRFTALDAVGPYEVLSRLPGATVTFVAAEPGPIATDNGMLAHRRRARARRAARPRHRRRARRPRDARDDERHEPARLGAHRARDDRLDDLGVHRLALLGAAGLLDGLEATTHWMALDTLAVDRRAPDRPSASSSRARSSPPPACRPASTWASRSPRRSRATTSPRRSSSASSTTRSRRSTPARPRRRPTHVVAICRGVEALIDAGQPAA